MKLLKVFTLVVVFKSVHFFCGVQHCLLMYKKQKDAEMVFTDT